MNAQSVSSVIVWFFSNVSTIRLPRLPSDDVSVGQTVPNDERFVGANVNVFFRHKMLL